jgi:hypothetical protein
MLTFKTNELNIELVIQVSGQKMRKSNVHARSAWTNKPKLLLTSYYYTILYYWESLTLSPSTIVDHQHKWMLITLSASASEGSLWGWWCQHHHKWIINYSGPQHSLPPKSRKQKAFYLWLLRFSSYGGTLQLQWWGFAALWLVLVQSLESSAWWTITMRKRCPCTEEIWSRYNPNSKLELCVLRVVAGIWGIF